MKIHKSKIERPLDFNIESLELGKTHITLHGKNGESIWVRKDPDNNVMYLSNHALMFFPFPSWGMELPLCDDIDLYQYHKGKAEDSEITVIAEAYDALKEFIGEDDELDMEKYMVKFREEWGEDDEEFEDDDDLEPLE